MMPVPANLLPRQWIIPKMVPRDAVAVQVQRFVADLDAGKAFRIEVREYKATRSSAQNRYLWAIYDHILKVGGETMGGWTKEDLHDYFLGEHFGWEKVQLFGRFRLKPVRRSSNLSKQEFGDFVNFIGQYMAERGVVIPEPESDSGF